TASPRAGGSPPRRRGRARPARRAPAGAARGAESAGEAPAAARRSSLRELACDGVEAADDADDHHVVERADREHDHARSRGGGAVERDTGGRAAPHSSRSGCGCPSIPSSAMSRRKKSEVVQSVTTRSFRERSGSWYRWYERVTNQPRKPRSRMPSTSAIPL